MITTTTSRHDPQETINLAPRDATTALHSLMALTDQLRQADHRANLVFLDFYTIVTRRVTELLKTRDHGFRDPGWLSELTGVFAERALVPLYNAARGLPIDAAPWSLAIQPGQRVSPWVVGTLGMSAHINYDLPRVVYPWVKAHPERIADYRQVYFHVATAVLSAVVDECVWMVATRYRCRFTQLALALPGGQRRTSTRMMRLINSWRVTVWGSIMDLHYAADDERAAIYEAIDNRAVAIAQRLRDKHG